MSNSTIGRTNSGSAISARAEFSANDNFDVAQPPLNVRKLDLAARVLGRPSRFGGFDLEKSIEAQQAYWSQWNAAGREHRLSDTSLDQREVVTGWLRELHRTDLDIIEVGCGAGWLCPTLAEFGKVTATDLCEEVVARAQARMSEVRFVAGDFMALDFPIAAYDVIVSLEVLAHVADHDAFVAKLTRMLRPGGVLMMATQNRPVLERYNNVPPPADGQLRRWFDRDELRTLLAGHLTVREIFPITPRADKGAPRLLLGRQARKFIRRVPGRFIERALAPEFGWTLMARAERAPLSA
ncbi:MAG: class I SAM-dependent methyltransferase [Hyphomonadaceae bacterium]